MVAWKSNGTKRLYQSLPKVLHETLKICEPLRDSSGRSPYDQNA